MSSELAIHGGTPARPSPTWKRIISVGASFMGEAELEAARRVLDSRMFYKHWGSEVKTFEARFSRRFDLPNALAVNSGTSALDGILTALEIGSGDEVIVPAFGFIGVVAPLIGCGAVPRFCNVDHSLGLDVAEVEALVNRKTRAVIAVHMKGEPAQITALRELCQRRGLLLIEDVAQALGASFSGCALGSFGDAAYYSLQQFKLLTVGEGGVLSVRGEDRFRAAQLACDVASFWALQLEANPRLMRRCLANYRMSELQAALGSAQLEKLDSIRTALRTRQQGLLGKLSLPRSVQVRPRHVASEETTCQTLVLQLDEQAPVLEIEAALRAEGVEAALLYRPSEQVDRHFCKHWARAFGLDSFQHPFDSSGSEKILSRSLELQIDPLWQSGDIEQIALGIDKVLAHFAA